MVFKLLVLVFSFITLHGNGPGYFPPWGKDSDLMFYKEEPSLPKRDDPL